MAIKREDLFTSVHSPTVRNIVQLTQADYDNLITPDEETLYLIVELPQ